MERRDFIKGGAVATVAMALAPGAAFAAPPQKSNAKPGEIQGVFDVTRYRAKGDGITDDTVAIAAAIEDAHAAGGGVVWFPAGTYITETQTLYGAVTLQGTGWQSRLKLKGGAEAPVLSTVVGQLNYYGAVKDLCVDGNKTQNSSASAHGIRLWGAEYYRIEGVRVTSCAGAGIRGDGDSQHFTIAPYITNCYVDSCTKTGLHLNNYTYDVKADHVDVGLCDIGVQIPNSSFLQDISVWQCRVGFYGYWAVRTHLVTCRAERSKTNGFWFDGCKDLVVNGCRAYENSQDQGAAYHGFFVMGSDGHISERISFTGCHAGLPESPDEKQMSGIWLQDSSYVQRVVITGCVAEGGHAGSSIMVPPGRGHDVGHNIVTVAI